MKKLQIKLLYANYGWSIKEIAEFLDTPVTVVKMYLQEEGLLVEKKKEITSCPTDLVPFADAQVELLPAEKEKEKDDEFSRGLRQLKKGAVSKELSIAPIIAAIELTLLQKVHEAVRALGNSEESSAGDLALLTDTFKKLTKDSLLNISVKNEESASAPVRVEIAAMVFKD